jgi:two-component system alkaline phosphatase synthesis response regulator PhoP
MSGERTPAGRVAVVDDEEDVLTFVRIAMEDAGYEVATVSRPTEALEALEAFRPDLILLDLLMPEQMGISLYVEMRSSQVLAATPVVIITGLNARESLPLMTVTAATRPPTGYLEKPIDALSLLAAVRRALAAGTEAAP